jgi:two-component system, cell cycle response regulator DivK
MTLPLDAEQIDRIADSARRLEGRAGSHETELDALLATAEADVLLGRATLSRPRHVTEECVERLAMALAAQVRRREEDVATARQLCATAREYRLAAGRLVLDLGGCSEERTSSSGSRRPAVLVVDDYDDTRDLVCTVLQSGGFIVRTARNGLEAILTAYDIRPAVIVMDVSMPVLDGLEATRLIKAIDAIRDARVIAHTARPSFSALEDSTLFAAVLPKPALPEVVLAAVQQWVAA